MSLFNRQILNVLFENDREKPDRDPRDSITGFGNYYTSRGEPTPESLKLVNKVTSDIKNAKSDNDVIEIALKYKSISYGESQAVLHNILKSSNLKYNTVHNISHAPENAIPSEAFVGKITKELGYDSYQCWLDFKDLFIMNSEYSMQLTCLLLAGLVVIYDR